LALLNDFGLTEEQKLMRESLLTLAERVLPRERIQEMDENREWPREAYQELAKGGWLGLPYPEEYGGLGGSYKDIAVLLETLAYHYSGLATTYMTTPVYSGVHILHSGSEEMKREYLPSLIKGELYLCFALTEPHTGSDAAGIKTNAVRQGDDYIINGEKCWITSAHVADYIVLVVKTDPDAIPAHNGFSKFLVPTNAKGVDIRPLDTVGRRTTHTNQIFLDNVRVPARNMIGAENKAWKALMGGLNLERLAISANGAGGAQKALSLAQEYAKERVQFDQPISDFQAIQHKLSDMRIKAELARLMAYRVAEMMDAGFDCRVETSIAKIVGTENDFDCANMGMQIMGAAGYSMENEMQRMFRDTRLGPIGGGSNEIQRNIIAKSMGL
jgi:alkylation response protein AidB-like acyl-CoA dehydrogenase